MSANKESYDQLLVIFGASGDLTSRKLLPAFSELFSRGLLPDRFAILGAARSDFSDISFRRSRRQVLKGDRADEFLGKVYYLRFDPADPRAYPKLAKRIVRLRGELRLPDRILYYLATPPFMYPVIAQGLLESGLNVPEGEGGWRRIIVEKPFGSNLETARRLNGLLRGIFAEREIYRIDHYLGKETVQNILVLRFSNGIFEPLWNRNYIDRVEIRATETLGVGNRGKYYDGAGAMRDMVQNHLMQLMAFAAMEAPAVFEPEPMRDEIVKVFRSLRPYTAQRMDRDIVRAQYRGYREEKDVSPDSTTETFVAMKFYIDNWRWGGVPFLLYTGKKLDRKESEIVVRFKSTPQRLFAGQCSGSSCNKLTIRIQPDESVSLGFGLKMPGAGFRVKQVSIGFSLTIRCRTTICPTLTKGCFSTPYWAIRRFMREATRWRRAGKSSIRFCVTGPSIRPADCAFIRRVRRDPRRRWRSRDRTTRYCARKTEKICNYEYSLVFRRPRGDRGTDPANGRPDARLRRKLPCGLVRRRNGQTAIPILERTFRRPARLGSDSLLLGGRALRAARRSAKQLRDRRTPAVLASDRASLACAPNPGENSLPKPKPSAIRI